MPRPVWGPTERARERILAYGPMGVGKTKAALDIARKMVGSDNTMHVIDADNAWERMAPTDLLGTETHVSGEVEEWGNGPVELVHVRGWEQQATAMDRVLANVGRNDWIVVDSASIMWDDIAKWYIKKVHGNDLPDFLLQHRLQQVRDEKKATQGQDAMLVEWSFVNGLWHRTVTEPLTWAPCHVLVLAEAGEIRSDGRDSKPVKNLYGNSGWKPRTQKGLGYAMQTVLYLEKNAVGDYKFLSVKDREDSRGPRYEFEREAWGDFFSDYLRAVAGWKPMKP